MFEVSVPCGACSEPVRGGDDFCESCGGQVPEERKEAIRSRLEASHSEYAEHRKRVRSARTVIVALSVLFVLGGVVMYFITRSQADDALGKLSGASDSALLREPIAGASTVGELKAAIERELWQALGLNLFLAAVMLGLWFWSKKSLLAAVITALGIYVAVMVASALFDPKTLAQGIIMKIIVISALAKGVQSALAARKLELAR
jgi:hypothetical protein